MAIQLQLRRGTTAENDAFTGAVGEVTVDTGSKTLRIHDGTTVGGNRDYYSYTTNCITRTPQDIQLELNAGTLTLKTGSKVYVPNGSGVFDAVTISSDINVSAVANRTTMILYRNGGFQRMNTEYCYSGATAPTPGAATAIWYDTANNVIKYTNDTGSTWVQDNISLPLCIATETTTGFTEIKQVFNGLGYIGNTVFVLPGVKALVPYYRNSDGSLKNSAPVSSSVNVYTVSTPVNDHKYTLAFNGTLVPFYNNLVYNEQENRNYAGGSATAWADIGYIYFSGGKISRFFVKQPFHAVDYSDGEYIANCAMPSYRYIDLTLPADSETITAPADGYVMLNKASNAAGQRIGLIGNPGAREVVYSSATSQYLSVTIPVRKGQTVTVRYTAAGETTAFQFVYANGSK